MMEHEGLSRQREKKKKKKFVVSDTAGLKDSLYKHPDMDREVNRVSDEADRIFSDPLRRLSELADKGEVIRIRKKDGRDSFAPIRGPQRRQS